MRMNLLKFSLSFLAPREKKEGHPQFPVVRLSIKKGVVGL